MKLYHIYNEDFEIIKAEHFEEGTQPINSFYIENLNFLKPKVNPETLEVYEGATDQDIETARQKKIEELNLLQFNELWSTDWYFVRLAETGQEVPKEILNQRSEIRTKYENLKNENN